MLAGVKRGRPPKRGKQLGVQKEEKRKTGGKYPSHSTLYMEGTRENGAHRKKKKARQDCRAEEKGQGEAGSSSRSQKEVVGGETPGGVFAS